MSAPLCVTAQELASRGDIRKAVRTAAPCHLHYNGPGAAGFGVKRTAMLLPESAMLLVAPSCCGRHGTVTGKKTGFDERMFYLCLDERDVATGAYLKRIPQAAECVCRKNSPRALFLCMTCVDALLGTDLDRIGRQIQEKIGIPVVSCFMDPIARETRKAPMVSVQQAIMRCLQKGSPEKDAVNLLGGFVPLDASSELPEVLAQAGIRTIRQISACRTFDEYQEMGRSSLNIVINAQAQEAARDLQKRIGIPWTPMACTYGVSRTRKEYENLALAFGAALDTERYAQDAQNTLDEFAARHRGISVAVGEAVVGSPLEIALTLLEAGIDVPLLFRTLVQPSDMPLVRLIAERAPDLKIYSGVHPSMQSADFSGISADVALGLDAGYFLPQAVSVCWSSERQPLGFGGLKSLIAQIEESIQRPKTHREQMHGSYLVV
ncbi:MAG: nitrogenase component 1 [Pyramidobacter sp.]|nr:nitrogenase component 1 [Pyramidobacter sp.]